jgi:flagellar biosynthetic protein FlhB
VSEQKTEKPTAKKLRDARKEGQVFKSTDITQALLFLTGIGVLAMGGPAFVAQIRDLIQDFLRPEMLTGRLRPDEIVRHMGNAWGRGLLLTAPLLAAVAVVAAASNLLQVQPLFAPKAVSFKFDRLNVVKGFQNHFFKPRPYIELLKNVVKFAILGALVYFAIRSSLRDILLSARADPLTIGQLGAALMFGILVKAGVIFLILGAADYLLQRKLFMKEMMMSKYEVKKQYKEQEGDPHVKHMRKHLHQQLLAQSMTQNVPKADVVVVNPTHLAVAIEYDEQAMNAPVVTAKGQDFMAQRIIELAKEAGVPVMRNVPLARSLYQVELGEEVPEELYEAVAEVLNWVYQLAQVQENQRRTEG